VDLPENQIGTKIIAAAIAVHTALGPGLLESTYETCLVYELSKRAHSARKQLRLPLRYDDLYIEDAYRIDILVDNLVVLEVKAVEAVLQIHRSQLLSCLRFGGFRLGYLLNFNVPQMRDGIVRLVNGLPDSAPTANAQRPLR
jgi:GxxExxY protein